MFVLRIVWFYLNVVFFEIKWGVCDKEVNGGVFIMVDLKIKKRIMFKIGVGDRW